MWMLLQNACALSIRKKNATFSNTITCNPNWPEIQECLYPGLTAYDRPELCARVFKKKLDEVLRAINSGKWHTRWRLKADERGIQLGGGENGDNVFEDVVVVWRIYVIEYQARGLPHAHIVYRVEAPRRRSPRLRVFVTPSFVPAREIATIATHLRNSLTRPLLGPY